MAPIHPQARHQAFRDPSSTYGNPTHQAYRSPASQIQSQHQHKAQATAAQAGSSSSRNAPGTTQTATTRPLAQEETQYISTLFRTLNSPDLLTLRAIQRNESRAQCQKHIHDEINEFLSNIPPPSKDTTRVLGSTLLTTTSPENLVEVCSRAAAPSVAAKKITFTELVRRAQEHAGRKVRKSSVALDERRSSPRTSLGASSRADDRMDLDGEGDMLDDGVAATRLGGRVKGKQRARRRNWEGDDDRDILDVLD